MSLTKRMALDAGRAAGASAAKAWPVRSKATEAEANSILRRAAAVWVRDAQSFDYLQTALGDLFDPQRHRLGVDVAVSLPQNQPRQLPQMSQSVLLSNATFRLPVSTSRACCAITEIRRVKLSG